MLCLMRTVQIYKSTDSLLQVYLAYLHVTALEHWPYMDGIIIRLAITFGVDTTAIM